MDNMRRSSLGPAKALLIGGAAPDAERLAASLAPEAQVICFAADRAAAEAVRQALRQCRPDARVAVMLGDPALLVHKVSGPFDVILDAHREPAARLARLRALLAEGGELYG
jgi:spermidine synthase